VREFVQKKCLRLGAEFLWPLSFEMPVAANYGPNAERGHREEKQVVEQVIEEIEKIFEEMLPVVEH
jgi:hypothetical protein